jgi:hypothetical protein
MYLSNFYFVCVWLSALRLPNEAKTMTLSFNPDCLVSLKTRRAYRFDKLKTLAQVKRKTNEFKSYIIQTRAAKEGNRMGILCKIYDRFFFLVATAPSQVLNGFLVLSHDIKH